MVQVGSWYDGAAHRCSYKNRTITLLKPRLQEKRICLPKGAMMDVVDSGTLHHTCFVVNDLEKSAQALADSLSVKWNVWTIEPTDTKVHGRDVPFSFRVAIAQVGDSNYELIAPHTGRSLYAEQLESKGEGYHHTCIAYPSREAMQGAKDELVKQGREMLASASLGEYGEFCYFDIPETGGALELLYLKELPPPEKTIG